MTNELIEALRKATTGVFNANGHCTSRSNLTIADTDLICKHITTLATVSADEPADLAFIPRGGFTKYVSSEYADHWRNKAMQLAVELERVKRSALTLADSAHAISSDRLERARKLANESKPEVIDSERQANQILTEENEQLRQQLANKDAVISDDLNVINILENEIRDLRNKIADLETWRSYAFRAHPNIDCDVAFEASRYKP